MSEKKILAEYGVARAKITIFDAIWRLWNQRKSEGWSQAHLANSIGRDPAWVSRNLNAPGNWTIRTLGELVQALDGELNVNIEPLRTDEYNTCALDAYKTCMPKLPGHVPVYREAHSEIVYIPINLSILQPNPIPSETLDLLKL